MKIRLTGMLLLLFMVMAGWSLSWAAGYQDLIKEGDSWYAQRSDLSKAKMAAEVYRKAVAMDLNNAEGYWKLARALYWIGDASPQDQQLAIFEEAINAAKKGVELNPNIAATHYWLGVNYGLYGQVKGVLKSLALVDPIKQEANAVIKLDPFFEGGGGFLLIGRLYYKLPGLFGGDNDKSVEYLQQALKYGPQRWLTYVYLAETYMALKKNNEAKEVLEKALAGPCEPDRIPECQKWKKDAATVMAELKKKMQ
ncbi:MAG: TRAP transporter TatT component family protein [Pseudomonadota bacterium]